MNDDDLLSPAEADALIAQLRVVIDVPRNTWDAMTPGTWARQQPPPPGPRARNRMTLDAIEVRTLGDLAEPPGRSLATRAKKARERRAASREPSPLDPVARPLLIEARAYSVSLRVPNPVHAGVGP